MLTPDARSYCGRCQQQRQFHSQFKAQYPWVFHRRCVDTSACGAWTPETPEQATSRQSRGMATPFAGAQHAPGRESERVVTLPPAHKALVEELSRTARPIRVNPDKAI